MLSLGLLFTFKGGDLLALETIDFLFDHFDLSLELANLVE